MGKRIWIMGAISLVCTPLLAEAPVRPQRAVMVGGQSELDACNTTWKVVGRNPQGEVWLAVRSRPSVAAPQIARLRSGDMVYGCDGTGDQVWTGVVIYSADPRINCGVSSVIVRRQPYRGPCASGWVSRQRLELVAG
jgi:hypothetical protein